MRSVVTDNPAPEENAQTRLCSDFESQIREGSQPRIEDFVGQDRDSLLLARLLMIELRYRYLQGEDPSLSDYAGRFPEITGLLKRIGRYSSQLKRNIKKAHEVHRVRQNRIVRIGQYDLLAEVASKNDNVTVWRGWDREQKRAVAVRLISSHYQVSRSENLECYEWVLGFRHPHILKVYDLKLYGDENLLATEYIDGMSLKSAVEYGVFEAYQAAKVCEQLADGLHFLHQRGLAFERLGVSNVQLDVRGQAKLVDLGSLAKFDSPSSELEAFQTRSRLGSQSRDAIRLIQGNLISLGVLLHEMVTGNLVDNALELHAAAGKRVEALSPPRSLQSRIPFDLEAICLKALRGAENGGYTSGQAMADDLRRFRNALPVSAKRISPFFRIWKRLTLQAN
ncbi:serine/threonine protein kinase [Rubinisphaera sp. JC750]|uniref:serine/threonine protein kinase n=1 Tax=Rubinisphaera sp. JC750 TaxID=2898658 RepID=UPI001F015E41|nr:protein kinase [Rubinisphaera sp. JC750]